MFSCMPVCRPGIQSRLPAHCIAEGSTNSVHNRHRQGTLSKEPAPASRYNSQDCQSGDPRCVNCTHQFCQLSSRQASSSMSLRQCRCTVAHLTVLQQADASLHKISCTNSTCSTNSKLDYVIAMTSVHHLHWATFIGKSRDFNSSASRCHAHICLSISAPYPHTASLKARQPEVASAIASDAQPGTATCAAVYFGAR